MAYDRSRLMELLEAEIDIAKQAHAELVLKGVIMETAIEGLANLLDDLKADNVGDRSEEELALMQEVLAKRQAQRNKRDKEGMH